MKQKVTIEVDVPEGYEVVEFRNPSIGDWFLTKYGCVCQLSRISDCGDDSGRFILRRVKQYREPVLPADYGKQCEFSDDGEKWVVDSLSAWSKHSGSDYATWRAFGKNFGYYKFCRIEKEST